MAYSQSHRRLRSLFIFMGLCALTITPLAVQVIVHNMDVHAEASLSSNNSDTMHLTKEARPNIPQSPLPPRRPTLLPLPEAIIPTAPPMPPTPVGPRPPGLG
jgi:hypothetical protein